MFYHKIVVTNLSLGTDVGTHSIMAFFTHFYTFPIRTGIGAAFLMAASTTTITAA